MRKINTLIGGAAVALLAVPLAGQQGPPPALPAADVSFPAFEEATLDNGARVIVVRNAEQPIVSVNLRVASGNADDPTGKAGVAGATATLIDNGTANRSSEEIAQAVDFIGATLGAGAGDDWSSVTLTTTTPFLEEGLEVFADVVMNPSFPDDEVEKERRRQLTALEVQLSQPAVLASRRFFSEVYGEHPYGWSPTPESTEAITRDDLVAFHGAHYRPDNALIVVAGDVSADDVVGALNRHLATWTPGASADAERPAPPVSGARTLHFVHKPGLVQAVMRVGHLMPPATEGDWVGIDVAARVLGGGTTGWLFRILRGEKGYTYGAYGGATERLEAGYFQATAEVRNEVADSAMEELLILVERLRTDIPAEDLEKAQNFISGSFPLSIETPSQVAGQLATTLMLGREVDYIENYRGRAASFSTDDVEAIARQYIRPEIATVVVVGDANEILDMVTPFADEVRLWTPEGEPLDVADLAPLEMSLDVDLSELEPHKRVYSLLLQGQPLGESTAEVTRVEVDGAEAFLVTVSTVLPQGTIVQESTFGADFTPISFKNSGPGPQVELAYADGRVTGTATGPLGGEASEVDIDASSGALLPGMDGVAVAFSDLSSGSLDVLVVDAAEGTLTPVTFAVEGEETVTVPAGEFETYRIAIRGAQGGTIWVRKDFPHFMVRQEIAGQPVALELKEFVLP
ncbi:MAG: pitrilysin family protein [Gemmatimonadota bacterium]